MDTRSEGQKDRSAYAQADAASAAISKNPAGADVANVATDDFAARARAMNTPMGAACDLRNVAPLEGPDSDQNFANSPSNPSVDSGHRIADANLVPNSDQAAEFRSNRYQSAQHDAIARDHALRLQASGNGNGVTTVPKV